MRLNFFVAMFLFTLIFYGPQITAVGASNLEASCAQRLMVSIGEKSILESGVLEEIASSYVEAIWTGIIEIHRKYPHLEAGTEKEQSEQRNKMYSAFQVEVMEQLKWVVYHEFVANLRSNHFLLGKVDRASSSIQKLGVPQWGADLVLGLAVATPALAVIGASWIFFSQGDFGLALSLPPAGTAGGVFFASAYRAAEDRIQIQSEVLSGRFYNLVTEKLGAKLLSVFPKGLEEDETQANIALWSKSRQPQKIMDTVFGWYFIKGMMQKQEKVGVVDLN